MRVTDEVRGFQRHFAIRHGWWGSRARAIRRYLELHPEMNEETLKDYLKRGGGTLSKEEQSMIDDARREVAGDVTNQFPAPNGVRK